MNQHAAAVNNKNKLSLVYKHCHENNHSINFNNPKILIQNNNVRAIGDFLNPFLPPIIVVQLIEALNFPKFMFQLSKSALTKLLVDYILRSLGLIIIMLYWWVNCPNV